MSSKNKAYVISVSVGVGCYRHIKISGDAKLDELSEAILDAFYFINDHAHAFFMDNREWSDADSYYMDLGEHEIDKERHTCDYTLREAGLHEGKKFIYVFDFGDNWRFDCRVLKELDERMEEPEVIRAKGDPPPQYGEWDEEDNYSDDTHSEILKKVEAWCDAFSQTGEFKKLSGNSQDHFFFIASVFSEHMYNYHLLTPEKWTGYVLEEVISDVFPRKITADESLFSTIQPVLTAFFRYLNDEGHIQNADALIKSLNKNDACYA